MTLAVETSGTQVCVIGTEHTLATISSNKILIMVLDLVNAAAGDTFELRVKTRILTAGTTREYILGTFNGAQTIPIQSSIPVDSPYEAIFTIKQTAGTGRSVAWRVDSLGAITVEGSGTQTCTIGVEHSVFTTSNPRASAFCVDLTNSIAGDSFEIRVKMRALSAGVERDFINTAYSGVQAQPIQQSIPCDCPYGFTVSIKQLTGTGRNVDWRVDSFG